MVIASLDPKTLKGAVSTRKKDMPSISPFVYVSGIILPTESRSKEPCGTKYESEPQNKSTAKRMATTVIKERTLMLEKASSFLIVVFLVLVFASIIISPYRLICSCGNESVVKDF